MDVAALTVRWFDDGDEVALRDLVRFFETRLYAPASVRRALGDPVIDDLRADLIWRLLRADSGALRDKPHPVAYAKTAWRNALTSELRKWGPRSARAPEVRRHMETTAQTAVHPGRVIDAERALDLAQELTGKGRLAVLLTTRPDAISEEDWTELVAAHPPPPPQRPRAALDREDASLLLFPPDGEEDPASRRRRKGNFDRTWSRAVERLRLLLLPGAP